MRLPQSMVLPTRVILAFLLSLSGVSAFAAHGYSQLQSSPYRLSFGSVEVSQSFSQSVTLTNTGKTAISLSSISTSIRDVSTSGLTFPATLAAAQSAVLNLNFAPTAAGIVSGQVTVTSHATN